MFKIVSAKIDFSDFEKKILLHWETSRLVKKYLKRNDKTPPHKKFSFLDGPITANNPMGVHHAWGRTYKDLWQRFFNMLGYRQRFQNGFDEQGLWVEVEVEKELGFKNKKDIERFGIDKFVNLCKKRVKKFSRVQTEQSKRLGYFMDWENSYHTSSDENNYAIWNFLKVCHQKGYLYKGRDSVPWCPRCGTAISQHEILTEEYQEITHKAIYVKYKIKNSDETLLVWTTTPWTLPSNVAIAVNPKLIYGVWDLNGTSLIFAVARMKALGVNQKPKKTFKGKELVGRKYEGVFDQLPALKGIKHLIVGSEDLVTTEEGTGLVHIAPGAGEEDFDLAQKDNLPIIESIDEEANYIDGFGDLSAKNAKNNPGLIIEKLKEKKVLFRVENYKHRYPVCWRCKTELVWRVVDEWYIAMDRPSPAKPNSDGKPSVLREQMRQVAKKIKWIPEWGLERELDWLNNMADWLISKKRYWGLALPIWECGICGQFEVIGGRVELKKKAISGWKKFADHTPHRPWIDEVKIKCGQCGGVVKRIPDVGSPWLDAGIVPFSTLPSNWFPADFITESFPGQFKNWFYSLIAMATVLKNTNPFKTVLGFATLLDEKGEEMHKSKGNAIEFNEAADKIGVDVMRWLYLSQNPANNLLFGYTSADEVRKRFYLILWNVYSFFVTYANIDGWKPPFKKPTLKVGSNLLDKWLFSRFHTVVDHVTASLLSYNAQKACNKIEDFVINDLSTWYVRRSRDRVGINASKDDKNACYQTLYVVLLELSKLIAPFMPFIAEEIHTNLTTGISAHLVSWPPFDKKAINKRVEEEMSQARMIVEKTHALRKKAGIKVRQPLASLTTSAPLVLSQPVKDLIASEVNVKKINNIKGEKLLVKLDLKITPELKLEGNAREIVRQIQNLRKEAGCVLNEYVEVSLPFWPKKYEGFIKKETLASKIIKGSEFSVKRLI